MSTAPSLVPAVERASAILDLIAQASRPLRLAEIVESLGLPKSSAHGLCQTLCSLGLLHALPEGFAMGPKSLAWAQAFDTQSVLLNAFHAALSERPDLGRYAINLSLHDGAEVLYLASRKSDTPLGITFQAGMRLPAAYTATGKAFLAQLPATEVAALTTPWPAPFTPHSVADAQALAEQLQAIRESGIGVDESELREGMVCLGALIKAPSGAAVAAVALSLTLAECPPDARAGHAAVIRALAADISTRVFGREIAASS